MCISVYKKNKNIASCHTRAKVNYVKIFSNSIGSMNYIQYIPYMAQYMSNMSHLVVKKTWSHLVVKVFFFFLNT